MLKVFLTASFSLACTFFTILCVVKGIQKYLLNEDICLVSFKRFNQNSEQVYPTITLCFTSPIQEEKIHNLSNGQHNVLSYKRYLQGYFRDDQLNSIDYDDVTMDLEEYMLGYQVMLLNQKSISYDKMREHGQDDWMGPYVGLRSHRFKCFSFDIPFNLNQQIQSISIRLKPNLFTNETRPRELDWESEKMRSLMFALHLNGQVSLSFPNMKSSWRKRHPNAPKNYMMNFELNNMDVILSRNKEEAPCHKEWRKYDKGLIDNIIHHLGCRLPYWKLNSSSPFCTKQTEYEYIDDVIQKAFFESLSFPPPCKMIKQTQYDHTDIEYDSDAPGESGITIRVDFKPLNNNYKEIKQVMAFDIESLIGRYIN
jgi:hypothetical protein